MKVDFGVLVLDVHGQPFPTVVKTGASPVSATESIVVMESINMQPPADERRGLTVKEIMERGDLIRKVRDAAGEIELNEGEVKIVTESLAWASGRGPLFSHLVMSTILSKLQK